MVSTAPQTEPDPPRLPLHVKLRRFMAGVAGAAGNYNSRFAQPPADFMTPERRLNKPSLRGVGEAKDDRYLAFEDQFYNHDEVDESMKYYIGLLSQRAPSIGAKPRIVDLGAGRCELLEQLLAAGFDACGVEINSTEYDLGVQRGLPLVHTDAVSYLESQEDASLSGATLVQVVEHLQPDYFVRLTDLLARKLVKDGLAIIETVNPSCLLAHGGLWWDLTHVRFYPAETVNFYLASAGFSKSQVVYRRPVPPQYRVVDAPESYYYNYGIIATR